jgi:polar amino acid transport system substrate-binding protein
MLRIRVLLVAVLGVALIGCASVDSKPSADARAALAPTGKLRVGVYLGNPLSVVRDPNSQEMKGAGFELGQQLARRMEVPFEPVVYPSVGALLEGAKSNQWDVALFQVSPSRAKDFDFTPPIVEIELGYLVPSDSRLTSAADADAAGIRVAVQNKSQSDAILSRLLTRATLVRVGGLAAAMEVVKSGKADAIATIKPSLFELSRQFPGSRVLEGRFAQEYIAMAIPKGRDAGVPYARTFVEEAKSQGLVRAAVEKSGARGAVVAPPQSAP